MSHGPGRVRKVTLKGYRAFLRWRHTKLDERRRGHILENDECALGAMFHQHGQTLADAIAVQVFVLSEMLLDASAHEEEQDANQGTRDEYHPTHLWMYRLQEAGKRRSFAWFCI